MDLDKLRELYYDPSKGFGNLYTLWNLVKKSNLNLTFSEVKQFYDSQPTNQVYKNPNKNFHKITCDFGICLQIDLMDVGKFYKWNKPTKFIMNIIDVHSRYAWAHPLKSKDGIVISEIIDSLEFNRLVHRRARREGLNVVVR